MKAFVITLINKKNSIHSATMLRKSTSMFVECFPASCPRSVDPEIERKWTYPWNGDVTQGPEELKLVGYRTENKKAVIACTMSHMALWQRCVELDEPILILEHDAIFIKELPNDLLERAHPNFGAISINDPRGATRKSLEFYNKCISGPEIVNRTPYVDDENVPQGLPGHSAYIIKPWAAKYMLKLIDRYGMWPNDAIMCNQLFPWLGSTKEFYTTVQNTESTTTQ